MVLLPIEERRALARKILLDHPRWSDRRISHETGLSREMIGHHRSILGQEGKIAAKSRIFGRDGKEYRIRRTRHTGSLMTRITQLRLLANRVGDAVWDRADDRARRIFWQTAERLVEAAGESIDRETGELV